MVCYARPALRMAAVVLVLLVILGRSGVQLFPGHFDGTAALMLAISVAAGVAVVAAALTFVAFGSIRRRRAVAGGCVHCQFRCQQAMTGPPQRQSASQAGQRELASPRWPDRPAYRSGAAARSGVVTASQPAGRTAAQAAGVAAQSAGQAAGRTAERRERAGTPV
jgi:hypothetical protein